MSDDDARSFQVLLRRSNRACARAEISKHKDVWFQRFSTVNPLDFEPAERSTLYGYMAMFFPTSYAPWYASALRSETKESLLLQLYIGLVCGYIGPRQDVEMYLSPHGTFGTPRGRDYTESALRLMTGPPQSLQDARKEFHHKIREGRRASGLLNAIDMWILRVTRSGPYAGR
jgi:hypothetical protein